MHDLTRAAQQREHQSRARLGPRRGQLRFRAVPEHCARRATPGCRSSQPSPSIPRSRAFMEVARRVLAAMPKEETSRVPGVPIGTVRSRLSRDRTPKPLLSRRFELGLWHTVIPRSAMQDRSASSPVARMRAASRSGRRQLRSGRRGRHARGGAPLRQSPSSARFRDSGARRGRDAGDGYRRGRARGRRASAKA
jgi:hypothetical protein